MVRNTLIIILATLIIACSEETPTSVDIQSSLDEDLQTLIDDEELVGISAAIRWKGDLYQSAAGKSSEDIPLNSDLIFASGSVTKTFTAVLIMMLQERGILSTNDPVADWITEIDLNQEITIEHLLQHTSGIPDYLSDPSFFEVVLRDQSRIWEPIEIFDFVGEPLFEPGSHWSYSNTNYILLGMIVEKGFQDSYGASLRDEILDPLQLSNTFIPPFDDIPRERQAHPWFNDDNGELADMIDQPIGTLASLAWAAGAIYSTSEDITRFTSALFSGDLILPGSLEQMRTFFPVNEQGFDHFGGYGYGLMQLLTVREQWAHSGDYFGYASFYAFIPQDETVISFHVNQEIDEDVRVRISTKLIELTLR